MAHYLYNCPEYLESTFASFKVGLVPVNTNYRYADDELVYLWDNADAVAVVFHGTFVERIEGIRDRVPRRPDLAVGRRRHGAVPGLGRRPTRMPPAHRSEPGERRVRAPWGRSADDLYMLYTGGTTGHAQGRHVAPGRPLRPPQRRAASGATPRTAGPTTSEGRAGPERTGHRPSRRPAR